MASPKTMTSDAPVELSPFAGFDEAANGVLDYLQAKLGFGRHCG